MRPDFIFIGLGNPGKQYESTRHNIGFLAAEHLAVELKSGAFIDRKKFLSSVAEANLKGMNLFIVKPLTYMNRSGEAVKKLVDFYKLDPSKQILVCCDDVDLPLGTGRLRKNGGPGTHNGLKSVVESLGEAFPRLRIGFGPQPKEKDLTSWVLSVMTPEEWKKIEAAFKSIVAAIKEIRLLFRTTCCSRGHEAALRQA